MAIISHENLDAASFLCPEGVSIVCAGSFFSEENDCWLPTYAWKYDNDGYISGTMPSISEAIVMARNEWQSHIRIKNNE